MSKQKGKENITCSKCGESNYEELTEELKEVPNFNYETDRGFKCLGCGSEFFLIVYGGK